MALNSEDVKLLIQQLELDRQAYLNSHNKLQLQQHHHNKTSELLSMKSFRLTHVCVAQE